MKLRMDELENIEADRIKMIEDAQEVSTHMHTNFLICC